MTGRSTPLFKAIEKIVGHSFVLEDYKVRSVTEGQDAQGRSFCPDPA